MIRNQQGYRSCVLAAIAFCAFTGCFGSAQDSALGRQIAAIGEMAAKNRTALAEYTWKQQETVLVNDKFHDQQMFQAEIGHDGKIQRTPLDLPEAKLPGEQSNRGMREWLEQRKERALQKYAEEIRELADTYTQINPDLLRQAYEKGDISYQPTGGVNARLLVRNYAKSGDSVTLVFDVKSHDLQSLEASSYLNASTEPVQIVAKFLGTGDEINRADEITAVDKKRKLQLSIQNLDYQPRPRADVLTFRGPVLPAFAYKAIGATASEKLPLLPVSHQRELSESQRATVEPGFLAVPGMSVLGRQFAVPDARKLCRSLLDAVNDVILILEPKSLRIMDANRHAANVYGYSKKELVGKELRELTQEPLDYAYTIRSGRTFERTDIAKDGEKIEFLVSLSAINYWGRRAIVSINRDIRERKRIEAAITASEKRTRLLIEGISEIVALLNPSGVVRFISPQVQRVLGIAEPDVMGRSVFDFLHPDDRERAASEFAKTVSEPGEAVPSVLRFKGQHGRWVPFEVIANNQLKDPDVNGVIFTARDLRFRIEAEQAVRKANAEFDRQVEERTTDLAKANAALRIENQERRYAQTQLEYSLSLLHATLESTVDGILVISNAGLVSSCNQRFLDMWHIPRIAVAGLRSDDLLASAVQQLETPAEFLEDLHGKEAKFDTIGFKALNFKDGRIFECYSQPQRVDGVVAGRVWSFRDVTQARRLEEELRQSQKMEAVGRLAGGVAHDFNNVLMIISGYANQLLSDPALPESDRGYCEELVDAARRATALTRQLLAFSRKHPIQPQAVELNVLVREMAKMLQPLLSSRIQLVLNCRDQNLVVYADPSQLELVIMNLVLNARDAMANGGILSLTTAAETLPPDAVLPDSTREFVVLEVSDTGLGMPPEIKEHIFEPFFSTKEKGKGTGLGLAMVFGIVEQANGHITVESEPNHGTAFRIYLPLSSHKTALKPIPVETALQPGTGTLVLVEDEAGIRTMTRKYLETLGYKVLEADSGEEALRLFREHAATIELIVTDIIMPGIRGDDLVREIKKRHPNTAAIFISGYMDVGQLVDDTLMLEKPFLFPELGRAVEQALAKARSVASVDNSPRASGTNG